MKRFYCIKCHKWLTAEDLLFEDVAGMMAVRSKCCGERVSWVKRVK